MNEKISVIIPVYNVEKYIKQTLDCLCHQTYKDLEIICVLDAPTDNTPQIVRQYALGDNRIKIIEHEQNMGMATARNNGIKSATGVAIHFMDSDDLINVHFYEDLFRALTQTNSDAAVCDFYHERDNKWSHYNISSVVLSNRQDIWDMLQLNHVPSACRYLFRTKFLIDNQIKFHEDLKTIEDLATIPPAILKANRIVTVPGATYVYKHRQNSIMTTIDPAAVAIRDRNKEFARCIVSDALKEHGVERRTQILSTKNYRTFFNINLMKKVYYSTGVIKVYLFGMRILKID